MLYLLLLLFRQHVESNYLLRLHNQFLLLAVVLDLQLLLHSFKLNVLLHDGSKLLQSFEVLYFQLMVLLVFLIVSALVPSYSPLQLVDALLEFLLFLLGG